MSIETALSKNNTVLTIKLDNKFDYSKVQDFREAYEGLAESIQSIVIDLGRTEYMDSAALGMLLNMQKSLDSRVLNYEIINSQDSVLRILEISRFDKKFSIR